MTDDRLHTKSDKDDARHLSAVGRNGTVSHAVVAKDLAGIQSLLETAYPLFRKTRSTDVSFTYASEWVLDNFYIINRAIRLIKEDLTSGFYRTLPKLDEGRMRGYPRVLAISTKTLEDQDFLFDSTAFEQALNKLQTDVPLETGEIWAFPIFLRFSLLTYLTEALRILIQPHTDKPLPTINYLPEDFVSTDTGTGSDDDRSSLSNRVGNIIHSLRVISEINWNDFFESVSVLERLLRQDPTGV